MYRIRLWSFQRVQTFELDLWSKSPAGWKVQRKIDGAERGGVGEERGKGKRGETKKWRKNFAPQ